jgi:hypothetical protein
MKRTTCIGVLLAVALVAPTTASAHTMSLSGAARVAKATADRHARAKVFFAPDEWVRTAFASPRYCHRLSRHAVRCVVMWGYLANDGREAYCIGAVNVRYRSRTSHRTLSRVTDENCQVD